MTETLVRRPTYQEWSDACFDMKKQLPAPEFEKTPWGYHWNATRALYTNLIVDTFAAEYLFKQGRYSEEDFTRIKAGIVRAYHTYERFREANYLILESRVNEARRDYRGLTGEFNFNG